MAPGVRADAAVLYLHGGGYVIGSPRSHRHLAAAIGARGRASRAAARLPAGARASVPGGARGRGRSLRWLLARGIAPARIVVAGDSAGGGLTVATLLALRDRGLPLPAGGVCISPWVDLTCSGGSYATKAAADPIVTRESVAMMAQAYAGTGDQGAARLAAVRRPARPAAAARAGRERRGAARRRARPRRASEGGRRRRALEEWPAMIHVWHWFLADAGRGRARGRRIGAFVRERLRGPGPPSTTGSSW